MKFDARGGDWMPVATACVVSIVHVTGPAPFLYNADNPRTVAAPLLVVTDVGARLVRRGLLSPADAAAGWRQARVLVFRGGPVVWERPPDTALLHMRWDLFPRRAR